MALLSKLKQIIAALLKTRTVEKWTARLGLGAKLQRSVPAKFKIGYAVLAWERPDYLEACLDSLFQTNLHDYDITFLLQDDGSVDPSVKEILERPRDAKYKIVRNLTPKGPHNAGAAINKGIRKLLEMDDFDIIGFSDPDAIYHPEWLDQTLKVALWAKANHKDHVLGPFSSFNSSDFVYHNIYGRYESPYGNYVVKRQMGMVNYFYFREDFLKLGYFAENKDDETLMTQKFDRMRVRNFCTETSWVEHVGYSSSIQDLRGGTYAFAHGIQLAEGPWPVDYHKFRKFPENYYLENERHYYKIVYSITQHLNDNLFTKINQLRKRVFDFIGRVIMQYLSYGKTNRLWTRNLQDLHQSTQVQVRTQTRAAKPSNVKIDIVIPALDKDLDVLPFTVKALRQNIQHPIGKIIVISPPTERMLEFCQNNDVTFVDENKALPITVRDINYEVDGLNRSGWLFQQLLKWADGISSEDHYLIWDSDTVPITPVSFELDGKILFDVAEEYHDPYFPVFEKLTGLPVICPFSFTSHHIFVKQSWMKELKELIEQRHHMKWYEAIIANADRTTGSGVSDYDNLGQYCFTKHMDEIYVEYFYNCSFKRSKIMKLNSIIRRYRNKYKSASFHSYNA